MKFTKVHINAGLAVSFLFTLAVILVVKGGDTCAAVGLGGTIGVVAVHFAQRHNGDDE